MREHIVGSGASWLEIKPGVLVDTENKLRITLASFGPETPTDEANVWLGHDPHLHPDRLLVPMSAERFARLQKYVPEPVTEVPMVAFESDDFQYVYQTIGVRLMMMGECLCLDVNSSDELIGLNIEKVARFFSFENNIIAADFVLYTLKALVNLSEFRNDWPLSGLGTAVRRQVVRLREAPARELFHLAGEFRREEASEWVEIASREIVH